jgi:hypothetical protein
MSRLDEIASEKSDFDTLRELVARIALISHAPTQQYDRDAAHETVGSIGGKRPAGGDFDKPRHPGPNATAKDLEEYYDAHESWLSSYQRKTPAYFAERVGTHPTVRRIRALIVEAEEVYEAWRRTPPPQRGIDPERESFYWRCAIADEGGSSLTAQQLKDIRSKYSISTATIYRYRATYRGLRKSPTAKAV